MLLYHSNFAGTSPSICKQLCMSGFSLEERCSFHWQEMTFCKDVDKEMVIRTTNDF